MSARIDGPVDVRFWPKVAKAGADECWLWMASRNAAGYGVFRDERGMGLAHRTAYRLIIGPIPDGLFVCHHCDNPPCVNPAHLFVGDNRANVQDRVAKGRSGRSYQVGEANHYAQLDEAAVRNIRQAWAQGTKSQSVLAREFGTSQSNIHLIVAHKNWRHIA